MEKIYVLDTSVFLEGYSREFINKSCVTVGDVFDEVKTPKAQIELDSLIKAGLETVEPSDESIVRVEKTQQKTMDKLSDIDIKVLALALDLKGKGSDVVVVSDDYGIQNVATFLGLAYLSVSAEGIKKPFIWRRKCKVCGKESNETICDICGSETIVVPKKVKER